MATITGGAKNRAKAKLEELKKTWETNGGVGNFVPQTGTKEDYDKLVAAVEEATRKNESVAALTTRLQGLGSGVLTLAKTLGVVL